MAAMPTTRESGGSAIRFWASSRAASTRFGARRHAWFTGLASVATSATNMDAPNPATDAAALIVSGWRLLYVDPIRLRGLGGIAPRSR